MAIVIPDEKIREVMQGVIDNYLKPHFISLGMNASGKWLNSLEAYAENGTGYIRGIGYTVVLVSGRAPGKRPPIQPLQNWVQNKLGIGGDEGRGIAFAIANKIAKEGTDYYPEGTTLLEILNSQEVKQYIYTNIGAYITGAIRTEIKRVWQTQL